MKCKIRARRQL